MITSTIREQLAVFVPIWVATPSEVTAPKEADPAPAVPAPNNVEGLNTLLPPQVGDVPAQWLALLECLQKELQNVQYQVWEHPQKNNPTFFLLKE
ncbi:UNVERIFIED_CONTAM: hypothetical protein Sradi_6168300 [Sesamum radiatum]|uniref:Uncharacterized protein n=1 Tax=Sesamum radiatum TaxID=300843 RepID=A0AAW2K884_SESRA